jgi:hypothetical protein
MMNEDSQAGARPAVAKGSVLLMYLAEIGLPKDPMVD